MAEQLKAGPMIVEKQTVSKSVAMVLPQKGPADLPITDHRPLITLLGITYYLFIKLWVLND